MLLLQQQQQLDDSPKRDISDQEVLIWCYSNANSEFISANNSLQIVVNSCSCSAKDSNLVKLIRLQIDFVSEQLSDKSYQSLIHSTNESNSTSSSLNSEELVNNRNNEIENLRNVQKFLHKKYRLLLLLQSELKNCRCLCWDKCSSNDTILSHLQKSEFNCKMWFRQIKLMETKVEFNRQSLPFDMLRVMRQLLDTNQLNINSMPIALDFTNNNIESNGFQNNNNSDIDIKIENFPVNDISSNELMGNDSGNGSSLTATTVGFTVNEFKNENSFEESAKDMQIISYDSLINVNQEPTPLTLQPINNNDLTTTVQMVDQTEEIDQIEGQTFQELHPISSNVGLNYSAHEISLIRSNPGLHYHSFDYSSNCNTGSNDNPFSDDILPQITAIEIDQILNN